MPLLTLLALLRLMKQAKQNRRYSAFRTNLLGFFHDQWDSFSWPRLGSLVLGSKTSYLIGTVN